MATGNPQIDKLFAALQDPAQREMLATKAAANGPPPDTSMANLPNVPGVTPPPQPNQAFYSGLAGIGQQQPQQGGGTPEENKSKWLEFMNNLTDPNSPAMPLIAMGAKMLQPRYGGQTQGGRIGEGMMDFANLATTRRTQAQQASLREREVSSQEQLAEAQAGKLGAETQMTERDVESADVVDDLAKAKAELARAQAGAQGASGREEIIYDQMMASVLYKNNPDKYANPEEALEKWAKFKVDKGDTPLAKSLTQLMENLPYMPESRVGPTIDLIQEQIGDVGGVEAGSSVQRDADFKARAEQLRQSVPVEQVTDEQWLRFETTLKEQRRLAEEAYGADVVAQKIQEAKTRQGM